jgi:hypothetical protein
MGASFDVGPALRLTPLEGGGREVAFGADAGHLDLESLDDAGFARPVSSEPSRDGYAATVLTSTWQSRSPRRLRSRSMTAPSVGTIGSQARAQFRAHPVVSQTRSSTDQATDQTASRC